jgi:hypothetical protein|tara:strand:- start:3378 stop:3515 length:138 start_codon:yes stop_codon:yes gene_type:complete
MDGFVSSEDESMTVDSPVEVSRVFSKCVEHLERARGEKLRKRPDN